MSHKKPRALFICRVSDQYNDGTNNYHGRVAGLRNSARFCAEALQKQGIEAKVVVVNDNNDIDREVTQYNPSHVYIEALWVVPEKFDVLLSIPRHKSRKWIVRMHSEVPFMANEGIAIEWLTKYLKWPEVSISGNSLSLNRDLKILVRTTFPHMSEKEIDERVVYLPNCYDYAYIPERAYNNKHDGIINIGCFGAIRPLKNQLIQAFAAIDFVEKYYPGCKLRFHMNGDRVENVGAAQVNKNIKALFAANPRHELVMHPWMPHAEFMKVLTSMDLGMQVSYTETFNIVAADMTTAGVPMVVSDQIYWANSLFYANPNDTSDIVCKMLRATLLGKFGVALNRSKLRKQADKAARVWYDTIMKK